jgi:hypothetical protein
VHLYYFGSGSTAPALTRKIIESELIEQHHWLPQDIANIPYKRLQEHFLIIKQKNAVMQSKVSTQKFKQQNTTMTSGQTKRMVREL